MPTVLTKKTTVYRKFKGQRVQRRRQGMRRSLMVRAPTFTETIVRPANILAGAGDVFHVSMDEIPQLAQYSNLYRQYKINWAKITLLPDTNSYDGAITSGSGALMPRIAWAINDTPRVVPPSSEADLLQSNGAKVKPLVNQWAASFKPVPDVAVTNAASASLIPLKMPKSTFLNFSTGGNPNPAHYGISYWISQSLAGAGVRGAFHVVVKINFSLRDPQ